MPESTEFSIKVTSEDPKKKEEPEKDKDKEEGSSNLLKDVDKKDKDGDGDDELVRRFIFIWANWRLTLS